MLLIVDTTSSLMEVVVVGSAVAFVCPPTGPTTAVFTVGFATVFVTIEAEADGIASKTEPLAAPFD